MTSRKWRVLQAAKRKASRWLTRAEVVGIGIGLRHREGRWHDEVCIVVKIDWKLAAQPLRTRKRRPLPAWIEVVVDGRRSRVGVDVQETGGEVAGRHQGLVGSAVHHEGEAVGSVSAVVTADGNRLVLISGHVAKHAGRQLTIGGAIGVTQDPIRSKRLDHCLVDLKSSDPPEAVLVDGSELTGIRPIPSLTLGQTLYFHRTATGTRVPLILRHVEMSAPFWTPDGIVQMEGLVVTNGRTVEGDSGALLYDEKFRAVATLLGAFAGESYFIPCDYAFAALGIQLA